MATKKDGEIFAKTLETIVGKLNGLETRIGLAETANETTINTVVGELKMIVERIEKLESAVAAANPAGLETELKAIVDRLKTEPAAKPAEPVAAESKPAAKPPRGLEKPTAEEASRRALKAWETRRSRRSKPAGNPVDIATIVAAAVREAMAAK